VGGGLTFSGLMRLAVIDKKTLALSFWRGQGLIWTGSYGNRSSADHQVHWCRHRRQKCDLSELFDVA
jgi:hypothetical protein